VPDRALFETLARRDDVPGAAGVLEMKFLMTDVDTDHPRLFFMNTNTYSYHFDFATQAVGLQTDLHRFNAETYFTDQRRNLAGQVLAHDHFIAADGTTGLYALEFWPTDPVAAAHIVIAYRAIAAALPFAADLLRHHPAGQTQEALYAEDRAALEAAGVRSVLTVELFENVVFSPLNLGEGFGTLGVFGDGTQTRSPSSRDVVLFRSVPNDLGHVAGIMTDTPQTPLSHINLKARQDGTPNAYIKDASIDPRVAPFIDSLVHYTVASDGFGLREATQEEADAYFDAVRPAEPQTPVRDLDAVDPMPLSDLGHADAAAFGAKTANVAELARILPAGMVPDGFGIPFSLYHDFMTATGLYTQARETLAAEGFLADVAVREKALKALRKKIEKADVPSGIAAKIERVHAGFPVGRGIRCRSSTNNEDLVGFSGAGLYDSYTHRADEGPLVKSIKQVWASLWTLRAFDEREFYRVDHFTAAMGVLCHPNESDEQANGVAITRNIYDPNWPGFYINAQVGESLVTNPDAGAVPDEFLVSAIGPNGEYEVQYIRHSSEREPGQSVLGDAHLAELLDAMERIQEHFRVLYGAVGDATFAMDIEFKVTAEGLLSVKQARPAL